MMKTLMHIIQLVMQKIRYGFYVATDIQSRVVEVND